MGNANPTSGYHLAFDDEFDTLSVQEYGTATHKWQAHTPYNGDFGLAWFGVGTDPAFYPFSISSPGILRIAAQYDALHRHWQGGLLASTDSNNAGFSHAAPAYWECRMKLPTGPGSWPSFWLSGVSGIGKRTVNSGEIDVLEAYGIDMTYAHQNWHVWAPSGAQVTGGGNSYHASQSLTSIYRTYGCWVTATSLKFYIDGYLVYTLNSPDPALLEPMYAMIDFAMGGGWPLTGADEIDPNYMYVDYVQCWVPN